MKPGYLVAILCLCAASIAYAVDGGGVYWDGNSGGPGGGGGSTSVVTEVSPGIFEHDDGNGTVVTIPTNEVSTNATDAPDYLVNQITDYYGNPLTDNGGQLTFRGEQVNIQEASGDFVLFFGRFTRDDAGSVHSWGRAVYNGTLTNTVLQTANGLVPPGYRPLSTNFYCDVDLVSSDLVEYSARMRVVNNGLIIFEGLPSSSPFLFRLEYDCSWIEGI